MSPAAVHYVARSSAFEVAAALARGRMPAEELARWENELGHAFAAMSVEERRENLQPGAPSTNIRALIAWLNERSAPSWRR